MTLPVEKKFGKQKFENKKNSDFFKRYQKNFSPIKPLKKFKPLKLQNQNLTKRGILISPNRAKQCVYEYACYTYICSTIFKSNSVLDFL